jgi:4-carboxymuconolactone decarboxylase
MSEITFRDRELVALGAAMGSNCIPCIEHHISESRKAGLTDEEIGEAISLADKIRQVPAQKVLNAGLHILGKSVTSDAPSCGSASGSTMPSTKSSCC